MTAVFTHAALLSSPAEKVGKADGHFKSSASGLGPDDLADQLAALNVFARPPSPTASRLGASRRDAEATDAYMAAAFARPSSLVALTSLADPAPDLSLSLSALSLRAPSSTAKGPEPAAREGVNPFLKTTAPAAAKTADVKPLKLALRKKSTVSCFLKPSRTKSKPKLSPLATVTLATDVKLNAKNTQEDSTKREAETVEETKTEPASTPEVAEPKQTVKTEEPEEAKSEAKVPAAAEKARETFKSLPKRAAVIFPCDGLKIVWPSQASKPDTPKEKASLEPQPGSTPAVVPLQEIGTNRITIPSLKATANVFPPGCLKILEASQLGSTATAATKRKDKENIAPQQLSLSPSLKNQFAFPPVHKLVAPKPLASTVAPRHEDKENIAPQQLYLSPALKDQRALPTVDSLPAPKPPISHNRHALSHTAIQQGIRRSTRETFATSASQDQPQQDRLLNRQFTVWRDADEQVQRKQRKHQKQQYQEQLKPIPLTIDSSYPLPPASDSAICDLLDENYRTLVKGIHLLTIYDLDIAMGMPTANGDAAPSSLFSAAGNPQTAAPASNPFAAAAADKASEAPFNPFAAKASTPSTFGTVTTTAPQSASTTSIFARASSPASTDSAPPFNPFQAALNKANAASSAASAPQRASSPFGGFGLPSQSSTAPDTTSSPFASTTQPSQPPAPSPFSSAPIAAQTPSLTPNPFSQTPQAPSPSQGLSPPGPSSGSTPITNGTNGSSKAFGGGATQYYPSIVGFAAAQRTANPSSNPATNPFNSAKPDAASPTASSVFAKLPSEPPNPFASSAGTGNVPGKKSVHFDLNATSSSDAQSQSGMANGTTKGKRTSDTTAFSSVLKSQKPAVSSIFSPRAPVKAPDEPQSDYAKRIYAQLEKDKIKPPQWPAEPGNPAKRGAMETFRENYKKYRDRARASLVKAGLIDDPEVRKRLDEAIDFKGICEDMCPEFEKISRIVQYDVKMQEKTEGSDGTMWASPPHMVKALARSAAGQEAPLPMDVRSVASLKRTLNYLIDTILGDDSRLPSTHNFLWDRTRAIRRDFVFHSTMSDEEMLEQVYCLENITRFHATALHLLSQKGFSAEDFSEQQEREQLGKALLSLMQAYDDCKEKEIECRNEAEFRAYFILLNAHDPDFQQKVSEWGAGLWEDSDNIQTAITLVQTMQSVWDWRGPVKPSVPTTTALGAFTTFFRIVESPQVSYTMACLAEIHFVHVRRGILRNVVKAYSRIRDSPKDLTITALNAMLRFDTDDEALDFIAQHGLEFSSGNRATAYLQLDKAAHIGSPTIRQSFSRNLVERKRGNRPLPEVIHTTIYDESDPSSAISNENKDNGSSLFVDQSRAQPTTSQSSTAATPAQPAVTATPSALAPNTNNGSSSSTFVPAPVPSPFSAPTQPQSIFTNPSPFASDNSKPKQADTSNLPKQSATLFQQGSTSAASSPFSSAASNQLFSTGPTPPPSKPSLAIGQAGLGSANSPSIFDSKPAPSSSASPLFSQATPKTEAAPEPPKVTSSSLFSQPTSRATTGTAADTTNAPSASALPPVSAIPTLKAVEAAQKRRLETPTENISPTDASQPLSKTPGQKSLLASPAPATSSFSQDSASQRAAEKIPPRVPDAPPVKTDLLGDFNKWFVLGDDGILHHFKEAFVEHIVKQTFEQFQRDEEERLRREEDERSWAEALKFKTYNLSVKFFYRWRKIARERALDRRARQARDEMKNYRAAKRAEQRAAIEKAAAEAQEKEAEARRLNSREVKFLEELGYYGDFGATSRKRKVSVSSERSASNLILGKTEETDREMVGSLSPEGARQGNFDDQITTSQFVEEEQQARRQQRLPVRQALKDGISHTVSRAKELFTHRPSSAARRGGRASLGSLDNESISGDSMRSVRSSRSPDSNKVAYYRRSVPGKGRVHSIFTRVSPRPEDSTGATTPQKVTNFMRYRNQRWSSPSSRAAAAAAAAVPSGAASFASSTNSHVGRYVPGSSPSPSQASTSIAGSHATGSNIRSSYWRLRAMGLVQMPNKQYLHESLALPMLQDGKRFPGVGSYGLPPVPTWDESNGNAAAAAGSSKRPALDEDEDDEAPHTETYEEERLRRTLGSSNGLLSRKRVFSGGNDDRLGETAAASHSLGAGPSTAAFTSPPEAKKARMQPEAADLDLDETERVIREMREMADAMDQGKDWFKEQTELMKSGVSVWDQ